MADFENRIPEDETIIAPDSKENKSTFSLGQRIAPRSTAAV